MRVLGRRLDPARSDRGMTLVEVMVAFLLLAIVTTGLTLIITNGLKTQALTERTDRITGITQVVMSKARQADFAELGYHTADGVSAGNVTVPVSPITSGTAGPSVTEQRVILDGPRPPGTTPFAPPVQSITNESGVNYRISTQVTWVPNPGGVGTPTAKRVTVTTQWAPHPTSLTGNCSQAGTRCTTNSFIRTATASDMDPVTGDSPTTACTPGAKVICEAYVRAGRVLDGATMISTNDVPEQTAPVDLYVRTASAATAVKATWQWRNEAGAVVKTVTQNLTGGSDRTRWTAEVSPDSSGATSTYKGDIRPGAVDVIFTATIDGTNVPVTRPVFWSYAAADGANAITASVASAANWCSPLGAGQPVTVNVTGHSIGFTQATQNPSAKDRVELVFTTTTGGVTRTEKVPASVVPGSVVAQNQTQHDIITGGWVNAQWRATPPATERCDNRSMSVLVHRAIDQTVTPVILPLPATSPVVPALPAPTVTATVNQSTGAYTVSWTAPGGATGYEVEVTEQGEPTVTTTSTALSTTGTLTPGQGLTARVRATTQWSSSPWSTAATTRRTPAAASPSAVRAADTATFSWPAVPFATSYIVDVSVDGAPAVRTTQTGTTTSRDIERGQTLYVNVWTVASGATAATAGSTSISAPRWEQANLVNGWVNYFSGYSSATYTRTSEDVIVLGGLIRSGSLTNGSTLFTLPPGYRPASRLIFHTASNGTNGVRVDVAPDGTVLIEGTEAADSGWVALNNIRFLPADHPSSRVAITPQNGWATYGGAWGPLTVTRDGLNRVWSSGLQRVGTRGNPMTIGTLPAGYAPPHYLHLAAAGGGPTDAVLGIDSTVHDKGLGAAWLSMEGMWHTPANNTQFKPLALAAGWVHYGGAHGTPQYAKSADELVTLRGLIRGGTTTNGTVIATLPAGHRPERTHIFWVANNMHYARVDVTAAGEVIVREGTDNVWLALDSISFIADQ